MLWVRFGDCLIPLAVFILVKTSQSQIPETCDSQTGCCCSDLILGVQCNCLLLVWIDKCFVCDVSCLYHNYRIALLQDIRSRKTPHKPDSPSASTWTSSSEWRHGKCRKAEKNCRCYILHVYFVFYFSYLQFVKKYIYINSCNAKLRRQHRRTVKNNNRSNHEQKSNFARAAHFFVHFFAVVLHDYNVKPSQTS